MASSRSEAAEKLNELSQAGLIHHVTREHHFKDDVLYYWFTSAKDVSKALDAFSTLGGFARGANLVHVQYSALINRFKHIAGSLNITNILNDFYGCEDESGWDLSDLDNWRRNMKRWGFGRREDQDDAMVDRLSPLLLNIDPNDWDVTSDAEWESPYGILAQIALFDQVSRSVSGLVSAACISVLHVHVSRLVSVQHMLTIVIFALYCAIYHTTLQAFRGTPDAFKWDELAKRATRVALEKGYFETA